SAYNASLYYTEGGKKYRSKQIADNSTNGNSNPQVAECCDKYDELVAKLSEQGIKLDSQGDPIINNSSQPAVDKENTAVKTTEQDEEPLVTTPVSTSEVTPPSADNPELFRDAKRLEADEATLTSIKEMYENRLNAQQESINELKQQLANAKTEEEKKRIQKQLDKAQAQQELVSDKRNGVEKKLIDVRDKLTILIQQTGYVSKNVSQSIFSFDKDGYYSESNPIPIDEPISGELFYSIQLGVYSKQAFPQLFKGLYPLTSQTISGGTYKYRTGTFYSYQQAEDIKDKIRQLGINDAFIIAFYEKQNISISKAIRLELQK
ncbi:MAG: hypothetical protein JKY42_03935, partial [Flavobacteriales bacterium]|nr:hypothetical protein [Flavobacteriales bacterium]